MGADDSTRAKSVDRARRRSPPREPRRLTSPPGCPAGVDDTARHWPWRPGPRSFDLGGRVAAARRPLRHRKTGQSALCQREGCGEPPRMDPSEARLYTRNYAPDAHSAAQKSPGGGRRTEVVAWRRDGTRTRFPRPIRYSGPVRGSGKDRRRLQSCPKHMTLCSDARIDSPVTIPQSYLLANWTARALL
jgi:hypothetical protein